MTKCSNSFPLDHFGVVASPLLQAVINQSGDKRKRKTAFNNIERMLKSFALIPKTSKLKSFGLVTDEAGQISWQATFEAEIPRYADMIGVDAKGNLVAFDIKTESSKQRNERGSCDHRGTKVSREGQDVRSGLVTCECGTTLFAEEARSNGCIFNT
jgi:hypothetical protein